ncbi:MAG: methylenetetrahydrofolate reductase [NAD(P)H] [Clostridiales bacterium]|jgi:methylenetetrahydrofolate reductase (NADPH)|nr:methylenetetrahydrofolate reductase [NAD(P)H] [Clostridiales bacterium]
MKTTELFKYRQVFSLEVFPPKRTAAITEIYRALESLKDIAPDFISVTYGAGGSENSKATIEIASAIKNKYGVESVAHLPCVGLNKQEVLLFLKSLESEGIDNILALRGDISPEDRLSGDFRHANDLITYIKENGDFSIIGACYPEGHAESPSIEADIINLKRKVDAGANHLITQLFFDNQYFYEFLERTRKAGINVPIEAGIMPVINPKQIEKMVTLCRVDLPKKFLKIMERYENNPVAMRDAGIAYAVDQIVDLIAHDVDGIHLYTMNNSFIAHKIYEAVASLVIA